MATASNADLVNWSGQKDVSFYLKSKEIRGVKDINISASLDTEDQEADGEKYTKKKNAGSYQITLTAVLNAALGVDVKTVAIAMTEAARQGKSGYFYMSTKKLFPSSFMATDAKITNLRLTRSGKWSYAEVEFTLKQASKYGGGTGSSSTGGSPTGGGSSGGSTYTCTVYYCGSSLVVNSVTRTSTVSYEDAKKKAYAAVPGNAIWADTNKANAPKGNNPSSNGIVNKVANAVTTVANTVKNAVANVINTLSAAKAQSNKVMADANTKTTGGSTTTNAGLKLNLKNKNLVK